ncbi:MAG: glycosyltransferase family 4 protein [Anaerolineae bacterium]|nr:glycosyltransferase family 4 protein [Anaerolineae bacterium]
MTATNPSQKKLKILIALQYYLPHRTGVPLHIERVAKKLVERGHEVTVLAARHSIDLPRDETVDGIRIVRLWAAVRVSRGMIMPAYPWALYAFLGWRGYDVVWVSTPMLETALSAFMARLTGRGLISTHHGDLVLPTGLFNRFVSWFTFLNYRYMARQADRLIAYSQDYADHSYYLQPYIDQVRVISPPIMIPQPNPERVAELHERWSQEGAPVLGFAGRFVKEKRPDLAIRALETIRERYPKVRLVFAGNHLIKYENTWEESQALVQRFSEHLIFLGDIASPQALANYYGALDALLLTSDTECFALVQVEAMLCGVPVIMTDTPGGRVPVQATGMGLLAPRGDAEAIGQATLQVLETRAHYVRPRHEIEAIFNLEATVDAYEEELYRAAGQPFTRQGG